MAAIDFKINSAPLWNGLEKLKREAGRNGALSQRLLRIMGRSFVAVARRSFREASLQVPSPWPGYSPGPDGGPSRYALRKQARGRTRMLVDTGTLVESLRADNPAGDSIRVHSAAPYAMYHHTGTKSMPMRRFFPVTESEQLTPQGEAAIKSALLAVWNSMRK